MQERLELYRPPQVFGPDSVGGEYWSVPDLKRAVKQWYDVSYNSLSSNREIFARCGFSYQRPAQVYRSRSVTKVVEFEAGLEKMINLALNEPETVSCNKRDLICHNGIN